MAEAEETAGSSFRDKPRKTLATALDASLCLASQEDLPRCRQGKVTSLSSQMRPMPV